jgi:serine/threonine protein kinase
MTDLRDQLRRSLGDAYSIQRELGGGGMSRVFVAEDSSLGRSVVVKVLPAELAGSVSLARFQREISLAARLQHPHIVPLLAAGETDGLPYYTMPFVEGESLRAKLARGELPIGETISVLRDVARALEFAHSKGVTHRDIKPDNVLLAGTSAVVTDFGVAKALSDATDSGPLTSVGVALGTVGYMAPEQAAADPATDSRADIYSLGAMAYEMLAGHPPFAGRGLQATMAAHATEAPTPLVSLRPAAPPQLADLVMRCLAKRPADRPQTASEVLNALDSINVSGNAGAVTAPATSASRVSASLSRSRMFGAIGAVAAIVFAAVVLLRLGRSNEATAAGVRSIAVVPFVNQSHDTSFDYLEDGITDRVRDVLNAIPALSVKARSSSQQVKGRPSKEIGKALGVRFVLQGALNRSNSRLHVTTELVRTSDDNALWSWTFDGEPGQLASIQDTIARAVAQKLGLPTASSQSATRFRSAGTSSVEAYDLFLQGRHLYDRLEFPRAVDLFQRAIARDSTFAHAHAYLAMTYANLPVVANVSLDSVFSLAHASANRALALDSTAVEAYVAESYILADYMRFGDALKPLERALAVDSTSIDALFGYALALSQTGRVSEGLAPARRAYELDPLSQTANGIRGYLLAMNHQTDSALAISRAAVDLGPKNVLPRQALAFVLAFAGHADSALAEFKTAFQSDSTQFNGRANLVFGYALVGRWDDAARERALVMRDSSGGSPGYRRFLADVSFGDYAAAMTELERGVERREQLLGVYSIPCDPLFDPLKSNPRFEPLMRRIGARTCPPTYKWPIAPPPRSAARR